MDMNCSAGAAMAVPANENLRLRELDGSYPFLAHRSVAEIESGAPPRIPVDTIERAVNARYGVSRAQVRAKHPGNVASNELHARQLGMYLARKLTPCSYPVIGRVFGRFHHTTVIHAVRRVEKRIARDPTFAREVDSLAEGLRQFRPEVLA